MTVFKDNIDELLFEIEHNLRINACCVQIQKKYVGATKEYNYWKNKYEEMSGAFTLSKAGSEQLMLQDNPWSKLFDRDARHAHRFFSLARTSFSWRSYRYMCFYKEKIQYLENRYKSFMNLRQLIKDRKWDAAIKLLNTPPPKYRLSDVVADERGTSQMIDDFAQELD